MFFITWFASLSLPLQGIDDIHGHHGLPPCVLSVGHGITDHVLQKDLEDATCLLVDQTADMLHSTPASQTTNRRLRDPLDVIVKNLTASFRSSLAQTLASLSTPRHFFEKLKEEESFLGFEIWNWNWLWFLMRKWWGFVWVFIEWGVLDLGFEVWAGINESRWISGLYRWLRDSIRVTWWRSMWAVDKMEMDGEDSSECGDYGLCFFYNKKNCEMCLCFFWRVWGGANVQWNFSIWVFCKFGWVRRSARQSARTYSIFWLKL